MLAFSQDRARDMISFGRTGLSSAGKQQAAAPLAQLVMAASPATPRRTRSRGLATYLPKKPMNCYATIRLMYSFFLGFITKDVNRQVLYVISGQLICPSGRKILQRFSFLFLSW